MSKLKEIPEAHAYLPDDCKWTSISKDFLFSVSYNFNILGSFENFSGFICINVPEIQTKLASKEYKKWSNYNIELNHDIAEKLCNFIPTNE